MTATWYLLPALGADCQLRETSGFRARQALWTKWSYPDIYGSLYAYTFLTRPHIYIISLSFQFWVASNNGFLTSFSTEREERKVKATFPTLLLLCSTAEDASEHSLVVTRPPALRLLSCHQASAQEAAGCFRKPVLVGCFLVLHIVTWATEHIPKTHISETLPSSGCRVTSVSFSAMASCWKPVSESPWGVTESWNVAVTEV